MTMKKKIVVVDCSDDRHNIYRKKASTQNQYSCFLQKLEKLGNEIPLHILLYTDLICIGGGG